MSLIFIHLRVSLYTLLFLSSFVVYLHKKLSKFTQLGLFLHMYEVFSKYYEVKNVLQRSKYLSEWKIMIIFHVIDRNCKLNCFFDWFKRQKMNFDLVKGILGLL